MAKIRSLVVKDMNNCIFCGRPREHVHHAFGGRNRSASTKYHLLIPLCAEHHDMSNNSVHLNHDMDIQVKAMAQLAFENKYGHKKFMEVIGKNYREEQNEQSNRDGSLD